MLYVQYVDSEVLRLLNKKRKRETERQGDTDLY